MAALPTPAQEIDKLKAAIRALKDENETLVERVKQLQALVSLPEIKRKPILLSRAAAVVMGLLYRREIVTVDMIITLGACENLDLSRQYVAVILSALKTRMMRHGIRIETIRGLGVSMDGESKRKLDEVGYMTGRISRTK